MKNMSIEIAKILTKMIFAIIFGVMFWYFLEYLQPAVVGYRFACCERCGNILFDREQPILAFCAGLALFVVASLKIKGWKGILITIGVSLLSFYPYFFLTFWSGHPRQECTALNYPRGTLPFFNEFFMLVISGLWGGICAVIFTIYFLFKTYVGKREIENFNE